MSRSSSPVEEMEGSASSLSGEASPSRVTAPTLGVTGSSWGTTAPTSGSASTLSMEAGPGGDGSVGGVADPISTSSPSPEPEPVPPAGAHSLKDMARGVVLAVSARVAAAAARGEDEAAVAGLMATDKEQKSIGDPLAAIGARHMKTSAGNPDIADLIVAGIAAVGYAFRVAAGVWNLKRARAAMAAATGDPVETAPSEGAM